MTTPDYATLPVQDRRRAFAEDTFTYFADGRCISDEGDCQYLPGNGFDGCALGRFMDTEHAAAADRGNDSAKTVYNDGRLPEWMAEMGVPFLTDIQRWHDADESREARRETITDKLNEY